MGKCDFESGKTGTPLYTISTRFFFLLLTSETGITGMQFHVFFLKQANPQIKVKLMLKLAEEESLQMILNRLVLAKTSNK